MHPGRCIISCEILMKMKVVSKNMSLFFWKLKASLWDETLADFSGFVLVLFALCLEYPAPIHPHTHQWASSLSLVQTASNPGIWKHFRVWFCNGAYNDAPVINQACPRRELGLNHTGKNESLRRGNTQAGWKDKWRSDLYSTSDRLHLRDWPPKDGNLSLFLMFWENVYSSTTMVMFLFFYVCLSGWISRITC